MILPKRVDIEKEKNLERKKEIDSGVQLAMKIDKLRETYANEEKQLKEWRENSIRTIRYEIGQLIEERDNLENQNKEDRALRVELLKPLDAEWQEVKLEKENIAEEYKNISHSKVTIKEQLEKIKKDLERISEVSARANQKEKDTTKAKEQAIALRDMAQKEYEVARANREEQTEMHEKSMLALDQRKKEYEVALSLIYIRENEVKDKESELITRENHLKTQQRQVQIAWSEIQKHNGNTNSSGN